MKKVASMLISFLFIGIMFIGVVEAQEVDVERKIQEEIDIRMESAYRGEASGVHMNIADDKNTEPHTWPIPMNGKYWGPYIPASIASLGDKGVIDFSTTIYLSEEVISTGASKYWVRIPVDGRTVESFSLSINDHDLGIYERVSASKPYVIWDERGIFILLQYPLHTHTTKGIYEFSVKNIIPTEGMGINILFSQEDYLPHRGQFVTVFTGDGEKYSFDTGVPFAWAFIFLRGVHSTGVYLYDFQQIENNLIPRAGFRHTSFHRLSEPQTAWDVYGEYRGGGIAQYVTIDGLQTTRLDSQDPYGGFSSVSDVPHLPEGMEIEIEYNTTGYYVWDKRLWDDQYIKPEYARYIHAQGIMASQSGDRPITISMPFIGTTSFDILLAIEVEPYPSGDNEYRIYHQRTQVFNDYLLYSFPEYDHETTGPWDGRYRLWIIPHESIQLFSSVIDPTHHSNKRIFVSRQGYYDYEQYRGAVSADGGSENFLPSPYHEQRYQQINIHIGVCHTSGMFATVTNYPGYKYYDFGWGTGYIYPGDLTLYITLDDGTSMWFRDKTEMFFDVEILLDYYNETAGKPPRMYSAASIGHSISQRVSEREITSLGGMLTGAIRTLYERVHAFLTVIYNVLVDFITKAMIFLEELVLYLSWQLYGVMLTLSTFGILYTTNLLATYTHLGKSEAIKEWKEGKEGIKQTFMRAKKGADVRTEKLARLTRRLRRNKK